MFTDIIFLILALLLINTIPESITPWIQSEWQAFAISLLLFLGFCTLIYVQHYVLKRLSKRSGFLLILVNLELLVYLIIYQYVLDAGRIFQLIPYMQNVVSFNAIWELILYLGGLAVHYSASFVHFYSYDKSESRFHYAIRQLRLLLPFVVPFLVITFALDIFNVVAGGDPSQAAVMQWLSAGLSLIIVILLLIFLPYFIQKIWQCKDLPSSPLKNRLQNLCEKAGFRHAGMKTWTIMHDQLTAGIVGVVPRFRYIMFTDRLLRELPPESIEAILAHEIGHNKHRHLLIYPFILAGMIVFAGLFFYFISGPLENFLEQQNASHPSVWWDLFTPLLIFAAYALIVVIYFRLVFGFFSRIFERQADLHIFDLGIAPHHMTNAFMSVAYACGGYDTPNWHHYSIKQRIEFINACMANTALIQRHHRKAKIAVVIYFVIFVSLTLLLIYFMLK